MRLVDIDNFTESDVNKILEKGIADCHCDTINFMTDGNNNYSYKFSQLNPSTHVDLPRLKQGNVKLQFFAVCPTDFPNDNLKQALIMIESFHRNVEYNFRDIGLVYSMEDLKKLKQQNKIAALLAIEGGEVLEGSIEVLGILYRLGVRSLSLTWNYQNQLADGALAEDFKRGLTAKGKKVIKAMEALGIIVDLAHLSTKSFEEAVEVISKPPLISHANSYKLCPHPRNLSDEKLKIIAEKKGLIGVSFYPPFITTNEVTKNNGFEKLLDHFVHIASLIGVEYIALGSDFDGIDQTIDGLKDATSYGCLIKGLLTRGFSRREVELITSENVYRLLYENLN